MAKAITLPNIDIDGQLKAIYSKFTSNKAKVLVTVVVVIILIIIVSKLVRLAKNQAAKANPGRAADGSKPLLSGVQIKSIARSQVKAIDQMGTDEDLLVNSIAHLNGADLIRVFNEVGLVPYNSTFGVVSSLFKNDLDLLGLYREELDPEDDQDTLMKLQSIWDRAGFKI